MAYMRRNEEIKPWYQEVIQKNILTIILLLGSAAITLLNTFAFIKLTPLIQNLDALKVRAETAEGRLGKSEENISHVTKSVTELKKDVEYIKEKVDEISEDVKYHIRN